MFRTQYSIVCAVFIAAAGLFTTVAQISAAGADDKKPAGDEQAKLIAVLRSDAPPAEKALACKGLAMHGGKEAVPVLVPLLADEQLASWARIALQAIPEPAAEDALRNAMGKLRGRLLIGVIHSITVRRDAKAVDGLIERSKDADTEVASAAAVALGHIGGPAASKALAASLSTAPASVRSAAAEGCILCAEKLLADGNRSAGHHPVRCSLQGGRAQAADHRGDPRGHPRSRRGRSAAAGRAVEIARNARFAIGLRVAAELAGHEVTAALAAELAQAAPPRQVLLLHVLADRGDTSALPAVLQAASAQAEDVRGAAVLALGRLGNASCVPVLLDAAAGGPSGTVADRGECPGRHSRQGSR